ncbi:MAG: universal stress protein [Haloplanus sp.]
MSNTVTYDEVLVATDGGNLAEAATQHALSLAVAFDATVHALAVVDTSVAGDYPSKRARANDAVEAVVGSAERAGVDCVTAVREGPSRPYSEIVDYRRENDLDLVAMGTHGRTGVRRYLLGSVAERVVRSAAVPVLVVPPTESDVRDPDYETLLVPVDSSDVARAAARHGVGVAERYGAAVHTLHAADEWSDRDAADVTGDTASADELLGTVTDWADEAQLTATDHRHSDGPVDAIEAAIAEYDVDLVAMGTQGESGVRRLVLGGTTERLLRGVHVPVLTVPPEER